jgi:hypothetical protein
MCDWRMEAMNTYSRLGGVRLGNYFPKSFLDNFPPSDVRPGHCLSCGMPMSHQEMFPPGRTARYMHETCYEQIALSGVKQCCLTCNGPLSQEEIYAQMQNPRELAHVLHQGPCKEYHNVLAGIVFGIPFNTGSAPMLPYYDNSTTFFGNSLPGRLNSPVAAGVQPVAIRRVKYLKLPE